MKPTFGALNATISKMITENSPKYSSITEPFGDGGTFALTMDKRKPKTHLVNIEDEELFNAFLAVQGLSASGKKQLKNQDWIASVDTFKNVLAVSDKEGPNFLYKFLYLKKFGMKMAGSDPEAQPEFDILSTGADASSMLEGLPLMRKLIKKIVISNEDPMKLVSAGSGFLILLPKKPEHTEAVQSKLSSLSGEFFFAGKAKDGMEVVEMAKKFSKLRVSGKKAASIMMSTMAVITNYENSLIPLDISEIKM